MKKFALSILLLSTVTACTTPVTSKIQETKTKETQNSIIQKNSNVFEVSKNEGANFSVSFNFSEGKMFKTKANTDGTPAKTGDDVKSVAVYLVESATGYASGGDPIGDKVAEPFNLNRTGTSDYTVTFSKVPANTATKSYYVAVRAFDAVGGTGVEIIKDNNGSATAWTGTTATPSLKVAVSSSSVSVNSSLVVTPTTAIPVTINLLDAVGATLESTITPNAGSNTLDFANVTAS